MRLFIYSMPLLALAMLASNYSIQLVKFENVRSGIDPQAAAISQAFTKKNHKRPRSSLKTKLVIAVMAEE